MFTKYKISANLIVFDWSGTLSLDMLPVYFANKIMMDNLNIALPDFNEWLESTQGSISEFMAKKGGNLSWQKIDKLYSQCYGKVTRENIKKPFLRFKAEEALDNLKIKGKTIAVLSSHPQEFLDREASEYKVSKYFRLIKGSVKDKSNSLVEICNELNFDNLESVYIGDTENDILAAKKARVYSIGITGGYHNQERLKKANPDVLIDMLSSLEEIIE